MNKLCNFQKTSSGKRRQRKRSVRQQDAAKLHALQLFAAAGEETLIAPRGQLCFKMCTFAPLRPDEWYDENVVETRCPYGYSNGADARHTHIVEAIEPVSVPLAYQRNPLVLCAVEEIRHFV